jgi:hypothetical protein
MMKDPIAILKEKIGQTVELGTRALDDRDLLEIERFDQKMRSIDAICRETFQDTFADSYSAIAAKLDRGEEINTLERKALEILFTGEAESYLKTENNFNDWLDELHRLIGELSRASDAGLETISELMQVQALCRDARQLLPEVQYYLREAERVELFRETLAGEITPESGRMLARLVREMLDSPDR